MNYSNLETVENHEFATSESYGGVIHILKVRESGRLDFNCVGCGKPMQAILRKIYGLKPYFRHDVQDVPVAQRCTFSNEQYRKKIALDTLQLEQQLFLPPLYKLPPKGSERLAIPILQRQLLQFSSMKRVQNVFQTPEGNIVFNNALLPEPNDFLLMADAVCYNEDGEPVLLILFSDGKRRKMDVGLMSALTQLRINTVMITPAKASPEEIYTGVLNGKNTKWLYHDDERQFDYFSLSEDLEGAIPAADVDQGQLFEETFECRKAEINNLIRAIDRCLGTEPYRAAAEHNRRIIGETESALRGAQERRDEFEERHREGSNAIHCIEFETIGARREQFKRTKGEFERTAQNLEKRYINKKRDLEQTSRTVESDIQAAQFQAIGRTKPIPTLRRELEQRIERAREHMDGLYNAELQSNNSQRRTVERAIASERTAVERIRSLIKKEPERLERLLDDKAVQFDQLETNARTAIERIQTDRANLPERFAGAAVELGAEFEELRNRTSAAAEARASEGTSGLSRRLKALMDGRRFFLVIEDAQSDLRQYRAAKEFLESPACEAWLRSYQR